MTEGVPHIADIPKELDQEPQHPRISIFKKFVESVEARRESHEDAKLTLIRIVNPALLTRLEAGGSLDELLVTLHQSIDEDETLIELLQEWHACLGNEEQGAEEKATTVETVKEEGPEPDQGDKQGHERASYAAQKGQDLIEPLFDRLWVISGVTHDCRDLNALDDDQISAAARAEVLSLTNESLKVWLQCWYEIALTAADDQQYPLYRAAMCAARMLLGDYQAALQHVEKALGRLGPGQQHLRFLTCLQHARTLLSIGHEKEAIQVLQSCRVLALRQAQSVSAAMCVQRELLLCNQVLLCQQVLAIVIFLTCLPGGAASC